jgi:hypothetical protein
VKDAFVAGFLIGVAVGLLTGPLLRWWVAVREWRDASREAELSDELLRRMGEEADPEPKGLPR